MKVHKEKVYSCNLGYIQGRGEYFSVIKRKVRSLCIKFINKALSSSLPVDVGQVWGEPR